MKRIGKVSVVLLAGLVLAGCSQKKDGTKSKYSSQIKVTYTKKTNKKGHLSADDLSPQKTVAVITAYAGNKYTGGWNKALKNGQGNSLQVNLRNQDDYSYMKDGSGVAYMVTSDAGYTLKQDGQDNIYYLFSNGKELESVSMTQMIDYLNKRNCDALVNNLAKNAEVNDERDSSDSSDTDSNQDNSNSEKKSNIQGDKGLFNVPAGIQGTWYTYYDGENKLFTLNIGKNSISSSESNQKSELHIIDGKFFNSHDYFKMPKSYQNATKDWCMVGFYDKPIHKIKFMNVRSWMQGAGDGNSFGLYTEKGQQVLVGASGAGLWTDCVYWKTPELAKQYKHQKFNDLYYRDDE